MREILGPFRAALAQGARRRVVLALGIGAVVVLGITAWSSYSILRQERRALTGTTLGSRYGMTCGGETCRFLGPAGPVGPTFDQREIFGSEPGDDPSDRGERRLRFFERVRPDLVRAQEQQIAELERAFAPRAIFPSRARTAGTLWGVLFAIMLGATLFGAEWRWSVWRTLLSHEPRRGLVLAGKLAALWVMVAIGFALALGAVVVLDVLFRTINDVEAGGGPGMRALAGEAARALVGLEAYATAAAAIATVTRSGVIALGAPLGFLLADGLLVQRYGWLRHYAPGQQVATLVPRTESSVIVSAMWWPQKLQTFRCSARGVCRTISHPPIPQGRAVAVLGAWIALFGLAAWGAMRARDVPQ